MNFCIVRFCHFANQLVLCQSRGGGFVSGWGGGKCIPLNQHSPDTTSPCAALAFSLCPRPGIFSSSSTRLLHWCGRFGRIGHSLPRSQLTQGPALSCPVGSSGVYIKQVSKVHQRFARLNRSAARITRRLFSTSVGGNCPRFWTRDWSSLRLSVNLRGNSLLSRCQCSFWNALRLSCGGTNR